MGRENARIFQVLRTNEHVVRGHPVDPIRDLVLNRRPTYPEDVVRRLDIALCSTRLRVGGILGALTASSVDPPAKGGRGNSDDSYSSRRNQYGPREPAGLRNRHGPN